MERRKHLRHNGVVKFDERSPDLRQGPDPLLGTALAHPQQKTVRSGPHRPEHLQVPPVRNAECSQPEPQQPESGCACSDHSRVPGTASLSSDGDEEPTRDRLHREILEHGPVTARQLSDGLGLTATAVRRHLEALLAAGHVAVWEPADSRRRGRGRPARRFVITDAGHEVMATGYGNLASEVLQFLEQSLGPEAVLAFARTRVAELERRYLPIVEAAGPEPADRAQALARALDADGYAASVRPLGFGEIPAVQLCQCHCPVHHVARSYPELCEAETEVFARLLGVHVRRLATLAHGEHVCTTHVPDRDGAQAPPRTPSRTGTPSRIPIGSRTSCGPAPPGSVASGTTPNSADSEETSRR
ncbi:MAG: hypothetical protein QG608_333 [Actinomycetota bacterium]|nr:hypothetical protein [Actinomycetota bacterium]